MRSVFEAATGLDAHMILNLLEQYGIAGRIEGEYLQGGVGELQAAGFVRVLVAEADYSEARRIIDEWESIQPDKEESMPEARSFSGGAMFFTGVVVGALAMYLLLRVAAA